MSKTIQFHKTVKNLFLFFFFDTHTRICHRYLDLPIPQHISHGYFPGRCKLENPEEPRIHKKFAKMQKITPYRLTKANKRPLPGGKPQQGRKE